MALLEPANIQTQEFKPMVIQGLGVIQPRVLTIASVHFEPRPRPDLHHSRQFDLTLPAAPKGKYVTRSFCDSQQAVRNFYGDPSNDTPEFVPMPVPVDLLADSLLDAWCRSGMDAFGKSRPRPGIILLAGNTPTEAEMKQMIGLETTLCRAVVEEADRLEKTGKGEITDFHRKALEWLGSEKRSWYKQIELGKTKRSPVSGNLINADATVDEGVDMVEWYVKYGLKPDDYGDDFIASMFKRDPGLRQRIGERLGIRQQGKQ